MKILIIDDHALMRQTIKAVLAAPGVEFVEGNDGDSAVRLCREHKPDWVLLDIKMEHIDGIEAARQIRQLGLNVPIIVVTQYGDSELRAAAASAGVSWYFLKDNLMQIRNLIHAGADCTILKCT